MASYEFLCMDKTNNVMITNKAMFAKFRPMTFDYDYSGESNDDYDEKQEYKKYLMKKTTFKKKIGLQKVWWKPVISYALYTYPREMSLEETRIAIGLAFNQWSSVVPLDFVDITNTGKVPDIKIVFDYSPCNVYAFTVPGNKIFFNTKFKWAYADVFKIIGGRYMDLFMIALHEIGHQVGIADQMGEKGSVMNMKSWMPQQDEYGIHIRTRLQKDDIEHAQKIYGSRRFMFRRFYVK